MSIERDICKAIDIITSKTISAANYGITILATVVECLNPFNGKYQIKYQSNNLIAYNNNINIFYDAETPVYVFLKNGQIDEELIILGPAHGNKDNTFYSIFKDVNFTTTSLNNYFRGQLELTKTENNNKIIANLSYMNHYVSQKEISNYTFNWRIRKMNDEGNPFTEYLENTTNVLNIEEFSNDNNILAVTCNVLICSEVMLSNSIDI